MTVGPQAAAVLINWRNIALTLFDPEGLSGDSR